MITEAQINELKAKYGNVLSQVTIHTKDKTVEYVIRIPPRSVIDAVASESRPGTVNVNEVSKILISNCVLAGDMDLIERDGNVYSTLLSRIKDEINDYKAEVKNL